MLDTIMMWLSINVGEGRNYISDWILSSSQINNKNQQTLGDEDAILLHRDVSLTNQLFTKSS